jgi:hypothetical protein
MVLGTGTRNQLKQLTVLRARGIAVQPALVREAAGRAAQRGVPVGFYNVYFGIGIPASTQVLEPVADSVGGWNEDNKKKMAPILARTAEALAAATTVQACFRAHLARKHLEPLLPSRLLRRCVHSPSGFQPAAERRTRGREL